MSSKVEELLKLDINEPVFGQTPWVSSLLAVPKENEASALKSDNTRVVMTTHEYLTCIKQILKYLEPIIL